MTDWKNRIVRYGVQPADQFTPNPKNPRKHPDKQRAAVTGSLDSVGILAPVVINARTGRMIDGHLRVDLALTNGNAELPFVEVDLSEEEEALALATFDFTTVMAEYDPAMLDSLLEGVHTDNAALQSMIAELVERISIPGSDDWQSALGALPDGDRAPFQQMTFTLHDDQAEIVKDAIAAARALGEFGDTDNENSNGNALARICEMFLGQYGQR